MSLASSFEKPSFTTRPPLLVADCNKKTATMEISKTQAPHANRSKLCVLESLEGVRHILEAVETCALYTVGTAGDALCAEVLEAVLCA